MQTWHIHTAPAGAAFPDPAGSRSSMSMAGASDVSSWSWSKCLIQVHHSSMSAGAAGPSPEGSTCVVIEDTALSNFFKAVQLIRSGTKIQI